MMNNVFTTPFVEAVHNHLYLNEMPSIELAVRLKMSKDAFTELMNGERDLTIDIAERLALVFETSTAYWMNLANASQQKNNNVYQMNQA